MKPERQAPTMSHEEMVAKRMEDSEFRAGTERPEPEEHSSLDWYASYCRGIVARPEVPVLTDEDVNRLVHELR
ncbi:MAG: hypothetical protein KAX51_06605 [Chromatiaceae bacterium]|nr:hypothetical protein [Chromatiaceae bacterium]